MTFRYFAYGSNLWPPQLRSRCPSARPLETARLHGWGLTCDKPSTDGSSKLNIRPDPESTVTGVVYEIEDRERTDLDTAEPLYTAIDVAISGSEAITYTYQGQPLAGQSYDWYAATVRAGAAQHGIDVPRMQAVADPLAPGIRPMDATGLRSMQDILAVGLAAATTRYYMHPGDLAWWVHHDDPRHPDHFSMWMQADSGFVTVDTRSPFEINVFTLPEFPRMPLLRWAQRRLGGQGVVGWVSDDDDEMVGDLRAEGYRPGDVDRSYEWDLDGDLPEPDPPDGFELRHLRGDEEADRRRAASHAAFDSTMAANVHLQRYHRLMRSPVYSLDRDLVAVAEDGTIAAFMIWWGDEVSGIAQIEPFGTHPDFQRRGVGRALLYHGLRQMRAAGMRLVRVSTQADRAATAFYEACGFADVGRLRWWRPT